MINSDRDPVTPTTSVRVEYVLQYHDGDRWEDAWHNPHGTAEAAEAQARHFATESTDPLRIIERTTTETVVIGYRAG